MNKYRRLLVVLLTCVMLAAQILAQKQRTTATRQKPLPIIDMHIHAEALSEFGGGELSVCSGEQEIILPAIDPKKPFKLQDVIPCKSPIKASATDEKLLAETLAMFQQYNVRRAVAMGPLKTVETWTAAGRERLIPALNFSDRDSNRRNTGGYITKVSSGYLLRSARNTGALALRIKFGNRISL